VARTHPVGGGSREADAAQTEAGFGVAWLCGGSMSRAAARDSGGGTMQLHATGWVCSALR
jgi:hypothetical protein